MRSHAITAALAAIVGIACGGYLASMNDVAAPVVVRQSAPDAVAVRIRAHGSDYTDAARRDLTRLVRSEIKRGKQ